MQGQTTHQHAFCFGADELDQLQSPIEMTLERALEYIGPGEMLEVTPESIRLRKINSKKNLKKLMTLDRQTRLFIYNDS